MFIVCVCLMRSETKAATAAAAAADYLRRRWRRLYDYIMCIIILYTILSRRPRWGKYYNQKENRKAYLYGRAVWFFRKVLFDILVCTLKFAEHRVSAVQVDSNYCKWDKYGRTESAVLYFRILWSCNRCILRMKEGKFD